MRERHKPLSEHVTTVEPEEARRLAIPPWFTSGSLRSAAATTHPRTHVQAPPRPVSDARRHTEPHHDTRCPVEALQGQTKSGPTHPNQDRGRRAAGPPLRTLGRELASDWRGEDPTPDAPSASGQA